MIIFQLFLAPLQVACILPQTALNTIFSNIEAIQAVNRELLNHMETLGVGDAFLAMAPFIKLYSSYANNFAKAQAELQVHYYFLNAFFKVKFFSLYLCSTCWMSW